MKKNMHKKVLSALITGALAASYAIPACAAEADETLTYETEDIVVTANRAGTSISDIPADVTLITQAEIERGNYKRVSDALKGANINVVQRSFASYPVINGDSRVLVMVDGKKTNWDHLMVSGDTNAVNVDQIPMENVERIEIVRGPNSSLYGERAVSGVVNIITKRPKSGKLTGAFTTRFGSWDGSYNGVSVSGGDEKNSIKVSVAHERRDDYDYKNAYGETRTFQNSDIKQTTYTVGYDHIMGDDRLRFDFSRYESDNGYGVSLRNTRTGEANYKYRQEVVDTSYGVTYMFGSEKEGEGTFLRFFRNENRADSAFTSPYTHDLRRNTFEGQKLWTLGDNHMLIAGFLWAKEFIHEYNGGATTDVSATTKALFFEDDWNLGQGYSVKFGSRLEHHDDFGSDVASHISLNKKFGRGTHAYISWGQAVNNPSLKMRYANTVYWKGNPDLEQERSYTYTIGASSQISPKWNVSVSLYRSRLNNALSWVNGVGGAPGYYENVETERRRGMELSTSYRPDDRWNLRAAYSFAHIDSTDPAKGYLSKNTRPNGYNLGASYTLGKWEADLDLNYVTGRSESRFTDSSYFTVDLGVNYHVSDTVKLYLKGLNLTNESYETLGDARLGIYAAPGRQIILGATVSF